MYLLPLTESASLQLTKSVISYQKQHDDQVLYQSLHEQTQQLMYELPSFLHLIDEEDCCEFLFFCYDAIPYYLNTYREGRLSYIGYLSQVVRKRSRKVISIISRQTRCLRKPWNMPCTAGFRQWCNKTSRLSLPFSRNCLSIGASHRL